ncbi:hypothetical protein DOY81_001878 [Sarcophaga bullata]|nr:hypothetical protein DOY81_001878 [Sarcophaga bullata]
MLLHNGLIVILTLLLTLAIARGHEFDSEQSLSKTDNLNDKLLEAFTNWYQDESEEKCQTPPSYIFDKWLPIQRRFDGSVNFDRNWLAYKQGFGSKQHGGEFFLGLQPLYNMSSKTPLELLIVLGDHDGKIAYAKYDNFILDGPDEDYAIKSLNNYKGTAGDALSLVVGQKFTTKDRDNDNSKLHNCAELRGGWWFKYCFQSHLNGPYVRQPIQATGERAIVWEDWHGMKYSLKLTLMLVRPMSQKDK